MSRRLSTKNQALTDQILAVIRDAEGFPLSTGQIARLLGDRLMSRKHHQPKPTDRPTCWPDDYQDAHLTGRAWCQRCSNFHRPPIWRGYDAQDIRRLLNRLADQGEIEKVMLDEIRHHFWRGSDA